MLLITGGTGSFGNAVLRRFLNSDIKEIRIFSRDEKKQELESMGRRGRQLVEQKYTSEAVARQFVNMYKTLMEKRYE